MHRLIPESSLGIYIIRYIFSHCDSSLVIIPDNRDINIWTIMWENIQSTRYLDFVYLDLAYFEVKIWSLLKHENLTTGNKLLWKRGEIAPKEQFLLFSTIFSIYLLHRNQIAYSFVKCGRLIYFSTVPQFWYVEVRISWKYFRESLGLKDNESQLYLLTCAPNEDWSQPAYPHSLSLHCLHEETLHPWLSKM